MGQFSTLSIYKDFYKMYNIENPKNDNFSPLPASKLVVINLPEYDPSSTRPIILAPTQEPIASNRINRDKPTHSTHLKENNENEVDITIDIPTSTSKVLEIAISKNNEDSLKKYYRITLQFDNLTLEKMAILSNGAIQHESKNRFSLWLSDVKIDNETIKNLNSKEYVEKATFNESNLTIIFQDKFKGEMEKRQIPDANKIYFDIYIK
jgi:hypothetical protein